MFGMCFSQHIEYQTKFHETKIHNKQNSYVTLMLKCSERWIKKVREKNCGLLLKTSAQRPVKNLGKKRNVNLHVNIFILSFNENFNEK